MKTTPVLVYFPMWGHRMAPSVIFWIEYGQLVEYAPNPDAYSVARARMEMNWKGPDESWESYFDRLADRNPNPSWWDIVEDVELSLDIPAEFREMLKQWG